MLSLRWVRVTLMLLLSFVLYVVLALAHSQAINYGLCIFVVWLCRERWGSDL